MVRSLASHSIVASNVSQAIARPTPNILDWPRWYATALLNYCWSTCLLQYSSICVVGLLVWSYDVGLSMMDSSKWWANRRKTLQIFFSCSMWRFLRRSKSWCCIVEEVSGVRATTSDFGCWTCFDPTKLTPAIIKQWQRQHPLIYHIVPLL